MKYLKSICALFFWGLLCLLPFSTCRAANNEIRNIDITVQLNQDGSAYITEIWDISVYSGTEWYLVQGNLGNINIEDFSVSDETGLEYEYEGAWDTGRSLEEKAGKCGLVSKGSEGYELCFGVGSYGDHIFTIRYRMTNFIKKFKDYCGFNQRVINDQLSSVPETISVTVLKPGTAFSPDDVAVWAFGFSGTIYVTDGVVSAKSNGPLSSDSYVNIMCRFPRDMFDTDNVVKGSFDTMRKKAFKGSEYKESLSDRPIVRIWKLLFFLSALGTATLAFHGRRTALKDMPQTFEQSQLLYQKWEGRKVYQIPLFWIASLFFFCIFPMIGVMYFLYPSFQRKFIAKPDSSTAAGKIYPLSGIKAKAKRNKTYFRELPLQSNICAVYTALKMTGLNASENDVIGAFLLRWLQSGYIEFRKTAKTGLGSAFGKEEPSIVLRCRPASDDWVETSLYDLLSKAAGKDGILQEKELYRWAKCHYEEMKEWLNRAFARGRLTLSSMDFYHRIYRPSYFNMHLKEDNAFTEKGRREMLHLYGFSNYLKDFTLMQEREPVDVALWDDYLVAAQLFGMADKVAETFSRLYPSRFTDPGSVYYSTEYDMLSTFYMLNALSHAGAKGAQSGASAAAASSSSASSGGGGYTSSGGGGGFSGGGSGGGSR